MTSIRASNVFSVTSPGVKMRHYFLKRENKADFPAVKFWFQFFVLPHTKWLMRLPHIGNDKREIKEATLTTDHVV